MRQITAVAAVAVVLVGCSSTGDGTAPDSSPSAAGAASEDGLEQVADAAETFVADLERWPHLGVYGDCVSNAEDWVIAIAAAIVGEGPDPTTDLYATFGTDDPRPDIYIDVGLQVAEVYASGSTPAPGSGHNLVKQACADAIEDGLYGAEAAASLADLVAAGHPRTAQAGEIGTPPDRSAEPEPRRTPESDGSAEPRVVEAR